MAEKLTYKDYERLGTFNKSQLHTIKMGLWHDIDVSIYANPKYDWKQMQEIRIGLQNGIDVSIYADPMYNSSQMYAIRKGLEAGLDPTTCIVSPNRSAQEIEQHFDEIICHKEGYYSRDFSAFQLSQIRLGLQNGVDVSIYADTKFDTLQMQEIRLGLESELDVSQYANPQYNCAQMHEKYIELLTDKADENNTPAKSTTHLNDPTARKSTAQAPRQRLLQQIGKQCQVASKHRITSPQRNDSHHIH